MGSIKGIAGMELNILVLGQTGVGKSTFINTLFCKDLAQTGVGLPCTPEGLFDYNENIDGVPVRLYDSWGLEVGKEEQWKNLLDTELKKRDINASIKDWFHIVVYCINGASKRVQDCDFNIIKQFTDEGYPLLIILTNADSITEEQEKDMKTTLKEGGVSEPIAICSVEEERRNGEKVKPFGYNLVKDKIQCNFRDLFLHRVPEIIIKGVLNENETLFNYLKGRIDCSGDQDLINCAENNGKALEKEIVSIHEKLDEKIANDIYDFINEYVSIEQAITVVIKSNKGLSEKIKLEAISISLISTTMPMGGAFLLWHFIPGVFADLVAGIAGLASYLLPSVKERERMKREKKRKELLMKLKMQFHEFCEHARKQTTAYLNTPECKEEIQKKLEEFIK